MIEYLENRCLLTSTLVNGTLTLTTVRISFETFIVDATPTTLTVDIIGEGFHFTYPTGSVQRLVIISTDRPANALGDVFLIGEGVELPTTINASTGDDTIFAGSGPTEVNADNGADYIVCGSGDDIVNAGGGRAQANMVAAADDTVFGGGGDDQLFGQGGPNAQTLGDILMGQDGDDSLEGGAGADLLDGGDGKDVLSYADKGGNGVDVVFYTVVDPLLPNQQYNAQPLATYNPANPLTPNNYPYRGYGTVALVQQVFVVDEGDNLMAGIDAYIESTFPEDLLNPGFFLFTYTDILSNFNLLSEDTFEVFQGGSGHDFFDVTISNNAYTLMGGDGVDTQRGGSGNDLILGEGNTGTGRGDVGGLEPSFGGIGEDTVDGGTGSDSVNGGAGNDCLTGGAGSDLMNGGLGDDSMDGGTGNDLMAGDDGDASPDTTPAGGGRDTMLGGTGPDGADTMQGDGGVDLADYSLRTDDLRIRPDIEHDDGNPTVNGGLGERDLVTESTEAILSGSGDDMLDTGGDGIGRSLNGGAGNDTMISGLGPDTFVGGTGTDAVDYIARLNPITVTQDGIANDGDATLNNGGAAGENDNVLSGIELIFTKDNPTGGGGGGGGGGGVVVPPAIPTQLRVTGFTYNSVSLRWLDTANTETGFIVLRRKLSDTGYTTAGTTGRNVSRFTDTGLEPNTVYVYRVESTNSAGPSAPSDFVKVTTGAATVAAPSNVSAKALASNRVQITWRDNSVTETQFQIFRQLGRTGGFASVGVVGAGVTTFIDQVGLLAGTEYGYQVRANNEFRTSSSTKTVFVTTLASGSMVAPNGLSVTVLSSTSNQLVWTDNADNETGYSVERAPVGSNSFDQIGTTAADAVTFTDNTAQAGKFYLYRVRAFNGTGFSAASNVVTSNLAKALATPKRLEALATGGRTIVLTWLDQALAETATVIERSNGPVDDFQVVAQVGPNVQSYKDENLDSRTNYRYRIRTTDGTNFSVYSNIANDTTLKLLQQSPPAPTGLRLKAVSSSRVKVSWRDNSPNNTAFQIERSTSLAGPFKAVDTVGADATTFTDSGLGEGIVYYYRVRARQGSIKSLATGIGKIRTLSDGVGTQGLSVAANVVFSKTAIVAGPRLLSELL